MPESLNIVLDTPSLGSTHSAGSVVSGKVIVETNKPMKYESVTVEFTGGAETHWADGLESCRHRDKRHHHSGKHGCHCVYRNNSKLYFSSSLEVWKQESTSDGLFPSGVSVFPFCFSLPQDIDLPSSFEGQNGWIRYIVDGQIRPSRGTPKSHSHSATATIPVRHSPPDVASEDQQQQEQWTMSLSLPEMYKHKRKVKFLDCDLGKVTLSVEMNQTSGFEMGEELPLKIYIENNTNSRIVLMASITRDEVYTFDGPHGPLTRKVTEEIAVHSSDAIHIGQMTIVNLAMTIPGNVDCFIEHCDIINLQFLLHLKLKVETTSTSVHAVSTSFPITFTNDSQIDSDSDTTELSEPAPAVAPWNLSPRHSPQVAQTSMSADDGSQSRMALTKLCFCIPRLYENRNQVDSLTCKSGKVTLCLDMPQRTEFKLSEKFPICVKITNYAGTEVMLITSIIKHAPACHHTNTPGPHWSSRPTMTLPRVTSELNSLFSEAVYPGQAITWRGELSIPETEDVIADLRNPNVKYFLKFSLQELNTVTASYSSDVYMTIPVSFEVVHDVEMMLPPAIDTLLHPGAEHESGSMDSEGQQDAAAHQRATELPPPISNINGSDLNAPTFQGQPEEVEMQHNNTIEVMYTTLVSAVDPSPSHSSLSDASHPHVLPRQVASTDTSPHSQRAMPGKGFVGTARVSLSETSIHVLSSEPPPSYEEAMKYLSLQGFSHSQS